MHPVTGNPPFRSTAFSSTAKLWLYWVGGCQAKYLQIECKSQKCSYSSLDSPELLTSANLANSPTPLGESFPQGSAPVETKAWKRTQSTGLVSSSTCFPSLCLRAVSFVPRTQELRCWFLTSTFLPFAGYVPPTLLQPSFPEDKVPSRFLLLSLRNHYINKSTPALH